VKAILGKVGAGSKQEFIASTLGAANRSGADRGTC
jgi:hypothetical protein